MAAAALNNARREAAHRLAEADEASFRAREQRAHDKRREEGVARRQMEGERERNRLRKLGARGGREWDEGKEENVGVGEAGRGRGARRGVYGGVSVDRGSGTGLGPGPGPATLDSGVDGDAQEGRGRGRGGANRRGRGRGRGGRGRGRGDTAFRAGELEKTDKPPAHLREEDFPALSSNRPPAVDGSTAEEPKKTEVKSLAGEKETWAEQMDHSDAKW